MKPSTLAVSMAARFEAKLKRHRRDSLPAEPSRLLGPGDAHAELEYAVVTAVAALGGWRRLYFAGGRRFDAEGFARAFDEAVRRGPPVEVRRWSEDDEEGVWP